MSHIVFRDNVIQCVFMCLKREYSVKMALYDDSYHTWSCFHRFVQAVPATDGTRKVYVINLHRLGK